MEKTERVCFSSSSRRRHRRSSSSSSFLRRWLAAISQGMRNYPTQWKRANQISWYFLHPTSSLIPANPLWNSAPALYPYPRTLSSTERVFFPSEVAKGCLFHTGSPFASPLVPDPPYSFPFLPFPFQPTPTPLFSIDSQPIPGFESAESKKSVERDILPPGEGG